jgi:hypothetical protein
VFGIGVVDSCAGMTGEVMLSLAGVIAPEAIRLDGEDVPADGTPLAAWAYDTGAGAATAATDATGATGAVADAFSTG